MATIQGRQYLPGGVVRPVVITHTPPSQTPTVPSQTPPSPSSPAVTPQRQPGTREGDEWWDTEAGKRQALEYYAQQRPQYQRYEISGDYYWGVTSSGMRERLNPVTQGVGPNPYAAVSGLGVGAQTTAFTQPKPTPPPAGSSKAQIRAYAESLASWERARLYASVPESMSYAERQEAFAPYANLLRPELREAEIYQSLLRPDISAEQRARQQYAQQHGTILSSSGNLAPLAGGGYANLTTGKRFVPASVTQTQAASALAGPDVVAGGAGIPSTRGGIIGAIARQQLGMDYLTGPGLFSGAGIGAGAAHPPLAGLSNTAYRAIGGIVSHPTIKALTNLPGPLKPIADFGKTVWAAGGYIGLDYLLGVKTEEYNRQFKTLESQGMIVGGEFRGTEAQFNRLDAQYQQLGALESMRAAALDRTLGINVAQAQAETARTGPVVKYGEDFTKWMNEKVFDPLTTRLGFGESIYHEPTVFTKHDYFKSPFFGPQLVIAGAFGLGVARGLASIPPLATQGLYSGEAYFKHPEALPGAVILGGYLMGRGMYEGLTTRPVVFAGELYGASIGLGLAGRGFSRVTGFGAGISTIPTGRVQRITAYEAGRMVTTEKPVTFSMGGIYWRNPLERPIFGRTETLSARPLAGAVWGEPVGRVTPFVGRYVVPEEVPIGTGYLPMTPGDWAFVRPTMETRLGGAEPFMRYVFSETFATRRVGYAMRGSAQPELAEEWGQVAPRTIPEPAWREVTDYIRANERDMVVYGSTTVRAHLGRYGRISLGDIDIDIRPEVAEMHSQNIYNIIRRYEPRIGELRHETSMITGDAGRYTARLPSGEIVLDLHPYWEAKWDIPGSRSGLTRSGGVRMMPLARTVWGKTMFFLQYREVAPGKAIIEPYSGRFKDPADISLIMGKYARDLATEPLTWDVMGFRTANRLKLAQEAARVSQTFGEYVHRYAPEGIELLAEARDPLRGVDLSWMQEARYNIKIGAITEVIITGKGKPFYEPSPHIVPIGGDYLLSPFVPLTPKPSPITGFNIPTARYPSPAARLIETYPSLISPGIGYYPSPKLIGNYLGGYPSTRYLQNYLKYPAGRYQGIPKYLTTPKYPTISRYPGAPRYPTPPRYPVTPKLPGYPQYTSTGKPPQYPIPGYPGRQVTPTITQYPGVTLKLTSEYPSQVIKPVSQKYPSITPTTPPRTTSVAPPSFPIPPVFPPISPTAFFPPVRRPIWFRKEKPPKPPKIQLGPDVLTSAWNIESPVPRIPQAFGWGKLSRRQNRNELQIFNLQKSRIPTVYVKRLPFEQVLKINVPKVI